MKNHNERNFTSLNWDSIICVHPEQVKVPETCTHLYFFPGKWYGFEKKGKVLSSRKSNV